MRCRQLPPTLAERIPKANHFWFKKIVWGHLTFSHPVLPYQRNMSARRIDSDLFQPVTVQTHATQLNVPGNSVRLRKNGIEFRCNTSIPQWTEMVITLQTPTTPR